MPIVSASYINQHCQLMQGMKRRPQARRCNKAVWGMSGMIHKWGSADVRRIAPC